ASSRHHVNEPPAMVAMADFVVAAHVRRERGRDRNEAAVADPVDHRNDGSSTVAADTLVPRADARGELGLELGDLLVDAPDRLFRIDTELFFFDLALALDLGQVSTLGLEVLY